MRSYIFITCLCILPCTIAAGQELPESTRQQVEEMVESRDAGPDEDLLEELDYYRTHPLELNEAGADDLRTFFFLTELQVNSFIRYRELLGYLVHIYELQAVPGWNLPTIRKLLPYVIVLDSRQPRTLPIKPQQEIWARVSSQVERARGYKEGVYKGDPLRLLIRYRYQHKKIQCGLTAEKDAGETFFGSASPKGFDFYSAYFSVKNAGVVRAFVAGDYVLNLGQGLVHWQGLAFGRGSDISAIKRQSPPVKPYTATGEFNFMRGAAITLKKGDWEITGALSFRKIDANLSRDSSGRTSFTSFNTSGYHRSENERSDRNAVTMFSAGTRISQRSDRWHLALNAEHYSFEHPYEKKEAPYNFYSIRGKNWFNASVDHSYTWRNLHLFGEMAIDKDLNKGILEGILLSAGRKADIAMFFRNIEPGYQSLFGNAFTQNSLPTNESGFFAGISVRPADEWKIDVYADLFRFPWLKFRTDAPSSGNEFSAQLNFNPTKTTIVYVRLRVRNRYENSGDAENPTTPLALKQDLNLRSHFQIAVSPAFQLRSRFEFTFTGPPGVAREEGFLFFADFLYKPMGKPFGGSARLCFFDTDGYASRLYAFENSVQSGYSVPVLYGRGSRYYINLNYDRGGHLACWLRWAQTRYPGVSTLGSGWDEILGINKSEWTVQVRWRF